MKLSFLHAQRSRQNIIFSHTAWSHTRLRFNVNVPETFESGMLLMWHISGFMNVIVGSQMASDVFIREMKGVVP